MFLGGRYTFAHSRGFRRTEREGDGVRMKRELESGETIIWTEFSKLIKGKKILLAYVARGISIRY